jgi:hypothetical protein
MWGMGQWNSDGSAIPRDSLECRAPARRENEAVRDPTRLIDRESVAMESGLYRAARNCGTRISRVNQRENSSEPVLFMWCESLNSSSRSVHSRASIRGTP